MKLEEFKQSLFNQKLNKRILFGNLKLSENIADLRKVFRHYHNHPLFKAIVGKLDRPASVSDLVEVRTIGYTKELYQELNWTIVSCEQYRDHINSFLVKKHTYEVKFLLGEYDAAAAMLKEIEIQHGISIWLLENELLLKEFKEGVKENWSQLSEYSKSISNPYVLFFLEKLSKRAEKNISYFRYKNLFSNIANELGVASVFNEYLCFKFSYSSFVGYANFDYYLWLENQFPIVDRYLTMIDILNELAIHHEFASTDGFKIIISELNQNFEDVRLKQLENWIKKTVIHVLPDSNPILSIFDLFGNQEYQECINLITKYITINPTYIELYEIYIKSLIELRKGFIPLEVTGNLINQVLENLYNIYSRTENNGESVENLLKLVQSFSSSSWAKVLLGQVANKINFSATVGNYLNYSYVNSDINNPRTIVANKSNPSEYLSFKKNYPESISVKIQGYVSSFEPELPELSITKKDIYEGRRLIKSGSFETATSHYEKILDEEKLTIPYYEEVIQNLFKCYIATSNLSGAIKLYCHNFLQNKYLVSSLEANALLQAIDNVDIISVSNNIELPIFFNIVGSDFYSQYVAYDSFLNSINVERATEVLDFDAFDHKAVLYFLKNVCKSDVMHYSLSFESSDDIENERIAICRLLVELDSENELEYFEEIANITQQSSIRNAIREVNKGKITININQLKSAEASNIKESFSRFRELASFTRNKDLVAIDSTSEILKNYLSNYENESELFDKVVFTNDPAFITFKIMFLEIRDKFILSKEYGLDGYLSTRIRHGTLKNHLRSLFESLNLITQKTNDGTYKENSHWENKIQHDGLNLVLQDALRTFSKEIDDLADYIIKELIQVKTEKFLDKKVALFDYSFTQEGLGSIFKHIRDANFKDYNEFLDLITGILIRRTEENLATIRSVLIHQVNEKFHLIVTQLQNALKLNEIDKLLPELSSSILKSNTDIQQELENIAAWFNLTEQSSNLILNNETIIKTAVEITNSIYPNNKIHPAINDQTDLYLSGQYCPQLIYINRILLDNIITHSLLGTDTLNVVISANLDQTKETSEIFSTVLNLSYINNLSSGIDKQELRQKLDLLKTKFNDPKAKFENINFEGGSGLEKIKKILTIDLNIKEYDLDFVLDEENIEVKLSMRVTIKIVNDDKK